MRPDGAEVENVVAAAPDIVHALEAFSWGTSSKSASPCTSCATRRPDVVGTLKDRTPVGWLEVGYRATRTSP